MDRGFISACSGFFDNLATSLLEKFKTIGLFPAWPMVLPMPGSIFRDHAPQGRPGLDRPGFSSLSGPGRRFTGRRRIYFQDVKQLPGTGF